MSDGVRIACLQTRPMPTMSAAVSEAMPMAEAAVQAGAQMLFLPEYCGGLTLDNSQLRPPSKPEREHPVLAELLAFAAKRRVWVNVGSLAVDGPPGKIVNRGYMIDDTGTIVGRYDKIHLFDVNISRDAVYRESDTVAAGSLASVYDTPFGKIGHTICYDLRFPRLFRDLAQAGASIICCPAAFTKTTGQAHWHVLNRARAIENTCYIVSPCAVGAIQGGGESYGHSLIVNPWGEVLSDGGDTPGVIHATLDLDLTRTTAGRIPNLFHDRPYGFAPLSKQGVA